MTLDRKPLTQEAKQAIGLNEDAFSLMNSLPQISQDPITVKVDTNERVSMKNHITDAESPGDISGLEITSMHMQLS